MLAHSRTWAPQSQTVQKYSGMRKGRYRLGYGRVGDSACQGGEAFQWVRFWKKKKKTSAHTGELGTGPVHPITARRLTRQNLAIPVERISHQCRY